MTTDLYKSVFEVFRVFTSGSFSPSHPSRRDKGGVFNPMPDCFLNDESGASILEGKSDIAMSTLTEIVEGLIF